MRVLDELLNASGCDVQAGGSVSDKKERLKSLLKVAEGWSVLVSLLFPP